MNWIKFKERKNKKNKQKDFSYQGRSSYFQMFLTRWKGLKDGEVFVGLAYQGKDIVF
jgi:hypothetical protein